MIDRRQLLKMAATMTTAFGLTNLPESVWAALKQITPDRVPKLVYLQGQSCSGCSISLLQAVSPSPLTMITDYSKLAFHTDLSASSGQQALDLIEQYLSGQAGEYFLAVEGSVPAEMPEACVIGGKPLASFLEQAAATMAGVIAIGTCAAHGGIPAAEGNPTGAISVGEFYQRRNQDVLLINIPGCPVHPDWVWHTITHLVKVGLPELKDGKPALFFSRSVHETCPRYHDFQQEIFAKKFGDKGCLFQLGCLGVNTLADCSTRWWNGGQTWCIDANAPCIGCASPMFARRKDFPFYNK